MIPADALSNLGLAQATVATVGTVMLIGLGFLHRPSRSALLWSLAFVLAMTSTWVSVAGSIVEDEAIRRAGLGLMLGAPALVWSGFRARRGVRALPWVGAAQAVDAEARHHRDQPGFRDARLPAAAVLPAQPGFLHDVLGVGAHAQHAVGDAEQARAQGLEDVDCGVHVD